MRLKVKDLDFSPLIERIIALDQNNDLYLQYLKEPWFKDNKIPDSTSSREHWQKIFSADAK